MGKQNYIEKDFKNIKIYVKSEPYKSSEKSAINQALSAQTNLLKNYNKPIEISSEVTLDFEKKFENIYDYLTDTSSGKYSSELTSLSGSGYELNKNLAYISFNDKEKHIYEKIKDEFICDYIKDNIKSKVKKITFIIVFDKSSSQKPDFETGDYFFKDPSKKITFKAFFSEHGAGKISKMFTMNFYKKTIPYDCSSSTQLKIKFDDIMSGFKKKYGKKYFIDIDNDSIHWYFCTNLSENKKIKIKKYILEKKFKEFDIKELNDVDELGLNKLGDYSTVYLLAKIEHGKSNKVNVCYYNNEDDAINGKLTKHTFEIEKTTTNKSFIAEVEKKFHEDGIDKKFDLVNKYGKMIDIKKIRRGENIYLKFNFKFELWGKEIQISSIFDYNNSDIELLFVISRIFNFKKEIIDFNDNFEYFNMVWCIYNSSGKIDVFKVWKVTNENSFIFLKYKDNDNNVLKDKKIEITSTNFDVEIFNKHKGIFKENNDGNNNAKVKVIVNDNEISNNENLNNEKISELRKVVEFPDALKPS